MEYDIEYDDAISVIYNYGAFKYVVLGDWTIVRLGDAGASRF